MNFYKVTVKCYNAQNAYFYHHCILAAHTRYEAMCHFMAAMALPNPPFVLGNGEYIDDMSARECEEIDSQVIFCSDGSISIEVLDESV